jgi:hypothetical protein
MADLSYRSLYQISRVWLTELFHRCAKLEIDLDPKSWHDAGLNIFPGIE